MNPSDRLSRRARVAARLRGAGTMIRLGYEADPVRLVAVFTLSVLGTVALVGSLYFFKTLADAATGGERGGAYLGAVLFATALAVSGVCQSLALSMRSTLVDKTNLLVDQRVMEITSGLPGLEHYERPDYADEVELLRQSRSQLPLVVDHLLVNVNVAVRILVTTGVLATIHPVFVLLPLFGVPSLWTSAITQRAAVQVAQSTAEASRLADAIFDVATAPASAKELRVFGCGPELARREREVRREIARTRRRVTLRLSAFNGLAWMAFAVAYLGTVLIVADLAVHGRASIGDVLLTLLLAAQLNSQVTLLGTSVKGMLRFVQAMDRYLWLQGVRDRWTGRQQHGPVRERIDTGIDLDGVTFRYPGTDTDVLRDVSLHIPAGSIVAVVGENGAGKSTLVKLLARFYEPDRGRILIDGRELAEMDLAEWRSRLSAGFQDFVRFELVVKENVGVGALDRIDDPVAISTALDRGGATDMVTTLPAGVDTLLGDSFVGGTQLSGGQWQRLALSRSMMRPAPLLVMLDEPTSGLDPQAEAELFERQARAARRVSAANGGITLYVSHRLSTVRTADLIVVLSDGRVAESGSHQALLRLGGTYADAYTSQARVYR